MNEISQQTTEAFAESFAAVKPLICAEWPAVEPAALDRTKGDWAKVVTLVVKTTEQDQAQVEKQLAELQQVAVEEDPEPAPAPAAGKRPVQEALRTMQARMNEVADYVRRQMVEDARTKARDNFLITLLMAIGLGFLLGFILRGFGRGRQ